MKKRPLLVALLLSLSIVGCSTEDSFSSNPDSINSGDPASGSNPQNVAVTGVSLNKNSAEKYLGYGNINLTATVSPSNATNQSVTWSSSNPEVATVNNGLVTPVSAGLTNITVTTVDGNKTANCEVRVKQLSSYVLFGIFGGDEEYSEKTLTVNPSNSSEYMITDLSLYQGDYFMIHMIGDRNYKYSDVKTSSTANAVEQGPNGYIKIKTSGVYSIYSSYNYDSYSQGYVHIEKTGDVGPAPVSVASVSLNHTGYYFGNVINESSYVYLTATVSPSNATNQNVSWSSDKPSVATVANNGRVQAVGYGKCTITATTEDGHKTATCVVMVNADSSPVYYLNGDIGGDYIGYGDYKYPAIPDTGSIFYIYDVEVYNGDEIKIRTSSGNIIKQHYNSNEDYVLKITGSHRFIKIKLNVYDPYYEYLRIVE